MISGPRHLKHGNLSCAELGIVFQVNVGEIGPDRVQTLLLPFHLKPKENVSFGLLAIFFVLQERKRLRSLKKTCSCSIKINCRRHLLFWERKQIFSQSNLHFTQQNPSARVPTHFENWKMTNEPFKQKWTFGRRDFYSFSSCASVLSPFWILQRANLCYFAISTLVFFWYVICTMATISYRSASDIINREK